MFPIFTPIMIPVDLGVKGDASIFLVSLMAIKSQEMYNNWSKWFKILRNIFVMRLLSFVEKFLFFITCIYDVYVISSYKIPKCWHCTAYCFVMFFFLFCLFCFLFSWKIDTILRKLTIAAISILRLVDTRVLSCKIENVSVAPLGKWKTNIIFYFTVINLKMTEISYLRR